MNKLTQVLIDYDSGEKSPQALVDWAIQQLADGEESEALNELAWLSNPGHAEARELFIIAGRELGFVFPIMENLKRLLAKKLAEKIVAGTKDPNEGCLEIAGISKELNSPQELSIFELLAHEQFGHEHIGITAENIRPAIIEAARKL